MNTGAFGENFPYSNFHDLNMDWIIKIAKDFLDQYTHIQDIISQGITDITNLTQEELEALQSKATELEALLQEWYDTHSHDIADQLADALADLNNWYNTHSQDIANQLTTAITNFNTSADQKAQDTLASIPADYTELSNNVSMLQDNIYSDDKIYCRQETFFKTSPEAYAAGLQDLAVAAKVLPRNTYIDNIVYKAARQHNPLILVYNYTTRELLYKKKLNTLVETGDMVTVSIGKQFSVETYIAVSCPYYVFATDATGTGTASAFYTIRYASADNANIGDILTYAGTPTGTNIYYQINIETIYTTLLDEIRNYSDFYESNELNYNNFFSDFAVLHKRLNANQIIDRIEYIVGAPHNPTIVIIDALSKTILYKERFPSSVNTGNSVVFEHLNLKFNNPVYICISAPQYTFATSPNGTYTKFVTIDYDTMMATNVGSTVEYKTEQDGPINYNADITVYETYATDPLSNALKRVLVVAKESDSTFNTIAEAVSHAMDGDVIYILPGVYEETINFNNKKLSLIGINRESVIIKNNTNTYATPAITMAKGELKHLTVLQDQDLTETLTNDFPYAVHIDHDNTLNETVVIDDCMLDAKFSAGVGIGLRENGKITIRNSIIKTEHNKNSRNVHIGAIFIHPGMTGNNQILEIENCQLESVYGSALHLQNVYQTAASAKVIMFKNFLWSDQVGIASGIITMAGTPQNVTIDTKSFGNNCTLTPLPI